MSTKLTYDWFEHLKNINFSVAKVNPKVYCCMYNVCSLILSSNFIVSSWDVSADGGSRLI